MRIEARFDEKELKKLTMQRAVTTRYNIKKGALNGGDSFKSDSSNNLVKPILSTPAKLQGGIDVRGERLALVALRGMITPKEPKSHKGKTMRQIKRMAAPSVKILKGKKTRFPHTFVAKGKGTHTNGQPVIGLFSRSKSGGVMMLKNTLSPANMVRETSVVNATQTAAREALEKNVAHEIEYRMGRLAK